MYRILYQVSENFLKSSGQHLSTVLPWYSQPKLCISVRAFNFRGSRGIYLTSSFLSQHCSVPEMCFPSLLSFAFLWSCDADCAQCPLPLLMLGVFGYLLLTSSLNASSNGLRHTALHVCTVPFGPWQASPLHFSFLNQVSVSLSLFTCCTATR